MNGMHVRRSAVAVVAATALATAACSGGDSGATPGKADLSVPDKKTGTVTMLTKYADPKYAPYFEKVVQQYETANPGVDIKLEQVGDQPYMQRRPRTRSGS